jgi:hypothetical protein
MHLNKYTETDSKLVADLAAGSEDWRVMAKEYGTSFEDNKNVQKLCSNDGYTIFFFLAALEFELRASRLLGRRSYHLSHSPRLQLYNSEYTKSHLYTLKG